MPWACISLQGQHMKVACACRCQAARILAVAVPVAHKAKAYTASHPVLTRAQIVAIHK